MPNAYTLEKSRSSPGKCLGNKISQKKLSAAGEGEHSTFLMKCESLKQVSKARSTGLNGFNREK